MGKKLRVFGGSHVDPFDFKPADVDIDTISHALAHQCRYAGHVARFYSVAEHCCILFDRLRDPWALMHDAAEAYLPDMPRPIKDRPEMRFYVEAEDQILLTVARVFGLTWPPPLAVGVADDEIWPREMVCLFDHACGGPGRPCVEGHGHYGAWGPERARQEFLKRWRSFQ